MKIRTIFVFFLLALLVSGCAGSSVSASVPTGTLPPPTATPFQPQADYGGVLAATATLPPSSAANLPPTLVVEGGGAVNPTPIIPGSLPGQAAANLNPLTGLPPADPALLERRPVAIKVTLFPRYARPQYGLMRADVVYEYYIEGFLTRFIAVFYGDNSPKVGPVRSGRFFDEHIARMYQAYLVFKNADDRVEKIWLESDLLPFLVVPRDDNCPPFCIDPVAVLRTGDPYNSYYFDLETWPDWLAWAGRDNSRPALNSSYFYAYPALSSQPAMRIFTRYSADSYHYWEFDPASGRYFRYQETASSRGQAEQYAPLMDALDNVQVSAANVVVLFVNYRFANQFDAADEVYHIDLVGSGQAYMFRDGVAVPAMWFRTATDQPIVIGDPYGNPLPLHPGNTFYEVIGTSSDMWQQGSDWFFQFYTP